MEVIDLVSEEEQEQEEAAASEAAASHTTIDATSDDADDANDAKDPSWTPEHELGLGGGHHTPFKPVVGPVQSPRLSQALLSRYYSPSGQKSSAQPKDPAAAAAAAAGQDQHAAPRQQQQQQQQLRGPQQAGCAADAAAAAAAGGAGASHRLRQSHQPFAQAAAAAAASGSPPPSPALPGAAVAAAAAAWPAAHAPGGLLWREAPSHEGTSAPGARSLWAAVEAAADKAGGAAAAPADTTRGGAAAAAAREREAAAGAAAPGAVAAPAEAAGAAAAADLLRAQVLALLNGPNGYTAGISMKGARAALAKAGRVLTDQEYETVKVICRQFAKQQRALERSNQQQQQQQQQQPSVLERSDHHHHQQQQQQQRAQPSVLERSNQQLHASESTASHLQQEPPGSSGVVPAPATAPHAAQAAGGPATKKQRPDGTGPSQPGAAAAAAAAALAAVSAAVPAPQQSSLLAARRPAPFACPQLEPQQDALTRQFGVWPETDASGDLLPSNCCSAGTAAFLSAFVAATLPRQAAGSSRPSRLGSSQQAAAVLSRATGGKKRGRPARGSSRQQSIKAAAASAAAGSSDDSQQTAAQQRQQQLQEGRGLLGLVTQQQQRQLKRYGFCWRAGGSSSRQLVVLADLSGSNGSSSSGSTFHHTQEQQQQQQRKGPQLSSLDALYGASVTAPDGSADHAAAMRDAQQQAALAMAQAEADPGEQHEQEQEQPASDDEFYQAVAVADSSRGGGQKTSFNMAEAPVRRFYEIYWSGRGLSAWALLRPVALATSGGLQALVRRLSLLTRVEVVRDPCHPCLHNPLEQPLPPEQPPDAAVAAAAAAAAELPQQRAPLMLLAASALPANQLLGIYWGSVMTLDEDLELAQADLSGLYGIKQAYTMDCEWSKACHPAPAGKSVVVVADATACRVALLNDAKHWAQEMGPCPRAAQGTCTCSRYAGRTANVRFESHLIYRASDGSYQPALAVFTTHAVAAGTELLASYQDDNSFWQIIQSNIRQYNYYRRLQLQAQGLAGSISRIQAAARAGVAAAAASPDAGPAATEQQQVLLDICRMADDALQNVQTSRS